MTKELLAGGSPSETGNELVKRSPVEPGQAYGEYRQILRKDFFYSCAYCTISEAEAQGIRLTIDHYEPRSSRSDLENAYDNLMYCCDPCNTYKGDRCPPLAARQDGQRFFRPDVDRFSDHFQLNGIRLIEKSVTGYFTIQALELNRSSLRRLRQIREKLSHCATLVEQGVRGLRNFPLDLLPKNIKGAAARAIRLIPLSQGTPYLGGGLFRG